MNGLYELDGISPEMPSDGSAWVAPGCAVIGRVTLGSEASVWFGAVLRGDNERISIGARTNIQEHCILHTDMGFPMQIGENCTIGHRVTLHGCKIGAGSLIGMGATILNGAEIGEGALIGAGALVPEGKKIPAGALAFGAPVKVVRDLSEGERKGLLGSAASYVANAARFRKGMRAAE